MGTLSTHDRLAAAAAALFYTQGITATGVDTVVRHAGVSKPTLYGHYRSKAELVAAALAFQHQSRRQTIEAYLDQRTDWPPADRLLAVFDWFKDRSTGPGRRGCAFLNAAAELVADEDEPARQIVRQHKQWWQACLADLARAAGALDPDRLASDLLLLIDGANARILVTGDAEVAVQARRVAGILLEASRHTDVVSGKNGAASGPRKPRARNRRHLGI